MSLEIMNKMPSRDAWLIYEYFVDKFEGLVGSIASTSYDALSNALNALGLTTERRAPFTSAVVKNRLTQLERIGVVVREKIAGALFSLRFLPFSSIDSNAGKETPEKVDHYGGRSLFDYVGDSVAGADERVDVPDKAAPVESIASVPTEKKPEIIAPSLRLNKTKMKTVLDSDSSKVQKIDSSPIVKNKLINKPKVALKEEKRKEASAEKNATGKTSSKKPTLNELVDRIDKTRPQIAALRARFVARVWEPWMRSDLIDRLVACVVYRWTSEKNAYAFCRRAIEERDVYRVTNARRGSACIWSTLALDVKQTIEAAGVKWQETRRGLEVEPLKARRSPVLSD